MSTAPLPVENSNVSAPQPELQVVPMHGISSNRVMLSRFRRALFILSYKEPHDGQDAVIVETVPERPTKAGIAISHVLELIIVIYGVGYIAGRLGSSIEHLTDGKHLSVTTLVGGIAAFMMWVIHILCRDIERNIQSHAKIADVLAPYFGHKLDTALRVLKAPVRAS